jgi:sulfur-carrier protein
MVRVYIPTALRELTAGEQMVDVNAATVRGVVAALENRFPGIAARLVLDDAIAPGLAVSIDGSFTPRGLLAEVKPQSEVHFLPAIGGG